MAKMTKYIPILVLAIALASLYYQYKTFEVTNGTCNCQDNTDDTGNGPIVS